jgi:hypothetical protein
LSLNQKARDQTVVTEAPVARPGIIIRDLRFLALLEMTNRGRRRIFCNCDTVSKGEKERFGRKTIRPAHKSFILFSIDRARRGVRAGIVGAAAEPEQIHEDFLAIFERGGFEQRLFFGGMKGERDA